MGPSHVFLGRYCLERGLMRLESKLLGGKLNSSAILDVVLDLFDPLQ